MTATIVEAGKLLEASAASLGGAILASLAFSLLIRGATRSTERRRQGRAAAAGAHAGLAVVGALGFLALLAAGLLVMISK